MRSLYHATLFQFRKINWSLLLFLLLVLNVKMVVKVAAILVLLLLNRKLFIRKETYKQKFTWFYWGMVIIAGFNLLLSFSSFSVDYSVAVLTGICFWLLCIGAAFLSHWFVSNTDKVKLDATITLFFVLNAIVTICQLVYIIFDAGSLNPYTYQGMYQKYFISTGDRLTGILFDVSTTNAIVNSFAVIYLLQRNKFNFVILCTVTMLLTASNFSNILLTAVLLFIFIFRSSKIQKSIIIICWLLLATFMIKISPQNNRYATNAMAKIAGGKLQKEMAAKSNTPLLQQPDNLLTDEQKRQKIALLYIDSLKNYKIPEADSIISQPVTEVIVPKADIHSAPYQRKKDTTAMQKELLSFAVENIPSFNPDLKKTKERQLPGKLLALQQTFNYFKSHPYKIITGAGTGNFASKLAFRTTALQIAGGYPKSLAYINEDFKTNHLNLYLNYFSKDMEFHSLIHSPNSSFDHVIAEYGIAGLLLFIFLYLAYFVKRIKTKGYGIPLLMVFLGALAVEYWFEQLSIVILFELMMLMDMKNSKLQDE
jgi:hypothetical protein